MNRKYNNFAAEMTLDTPVECECATFPESKHAAHWFESGWGGGEATDPYFFPAQVLSHASEHS